MFVASPEYHEDGSFESALKTMIKSVVHRQTDRPTSSFPNNCFTKVCLFIVIL